METIQIQVPSSLANAYHSADVELKKRTEIILNIQLQKIFSPLSSSERLLNVMQKASLEAKKNGLTIKKLNHLLSDE
ncbi:MAG: hypothetical protein EAZ53_13955 [Bacteroidetes bacterium]|nr:MAG: hypothetical protein EAZ53_13955 [Bacteroidota bacterium]